MVRGYRYATLLFEIDIVTLTFKILSGLYHRNCKVQEVDSWMGFWLGSLGVLNHSVTFNLGSAKVFLPSACETFFSERYMDSGK